MTELTPMQGKFLGDALFSVLIKAGMLREDSNVSGPMLLQAAKDFCEHEPDPKPETGLSQEVALIIDRMESLNIMLNRWGNWMDNPTPEALELAQKAMDSWKPGGRWYEKYDYSSPIWKEGKT